MDSGRFKSPVRTLDHLSADPRTRKGLLLLLLWDVPQKQRGVNYNR